MDPYVLIVITRSQFLVNRLRDAPNGEQFLIRWVPSASQALQLNVDPSLIILDLPPTGGARSVFRLKQRFDMPIVAIVRSQQSVPDLVDVEITSPYREADLVDLINATLINHAPKMVRVADMALDTESRRLQMGNTVLQLRPLGSQILAILMASAGQVVSRDELCRKVWESQDGHTKRTLDVHIAHLRNQLGEESRCPAVIQTVRGVGYCLQPGK